MREYREESVPWPTMIGQLGSCVVVALAVGWQLGLGLFVVAVGYGLVAGAYTVRMDADGVDAWLGIGVLSRRVSFREVHAWWVTRQPILGRMGVQVWPTGPMWGKTGAHAIEFQLQSGRVIRIPTSDPTAFAKRLGELRSDLTQLAGRSDVL